MSSLSLWKLIVAKTKDGYLSKMGVKVDKILEQFGLGELVLAPEVP